MRAGLCVSIEEAAAAASAVILPSTASLELLEYCCHTVDLATDCNLGRLKSPKPRGRRAVGRAAGVEVP